MEPRHRTASVGIALAPRRALPACAVAIAASLAFAGGAGGATTARSHSSHAAATPVRRTGHAAAAIVKKENVAKLGMVLVTAKGFTLYRYTPDKAGKVACTGVCASLWPPLLLPAGVKKPAGMAGLGTVRNPDGKLQVTYRGHPLYTYVGDKKAGTANGQGYLHKWYAVTPTVAQLTAAAKSTGGSGGTTTSWG